MILTGVQEFCNKYQGEISPGSIEPGTDMGLLQMFSVINMLSAYGTKLALSGQAPKTPQSADSIHREAVGNLRGHQLAFGL